MKSHDEEILKRISRRVRACDYLAVAQLFLQSDFLLEEPLTFDDIKPRLLGHWGTCHGINVAYANLRSFFSHDTVERHPGKNLEKKAPIDPFAVNSGPKVKDDYRPDHREIDPNFSFILGPGHGFPALQANLFIDGDLAAVDPKAQPNAEGLAYVCRQFSWPGGFPSHASPFTPGVICEGGELGYALGAAYGYALGHTERTVAVMLGDGEFETATALSSMNLVKLIGDHDTNGRVLPILHLNEYKISAPTIYGRKSERELHELIRGFGYTPIAIHGDQPVTFQAALHQAEKYEHPFLILRTEKGAGGPKMVDGRVVAGNYLAHQIPLPEAKSNPEQLQQLQTWLESYDFSDLFDPKKGFRI